MMSKNCQLVHILLRLLDNPSRNSVKLSWVAQLLLEINPISVAQEKWESRANIAGWDIFLLRLPDNSSRNRAELAIIANCSMCWCVLIRCVMIRNFNVQTKFFCPFVAVFQHITYKIITKYSFEIYMTYSMRCLELLTHHLNGVWVFYISETGGRVSGPLGRALHRAGRKHSSDSARACGDFPV